MRLLNILLLTVIFLFSCKGRRVVNGIPYEILSNCSDSLQLDIDGATHVGLIAITDSILIAQVFDKDTRKNSRLSVFNLKTKRWYGNFVWPDTMNSFYFGVAPEKNSLIYFSNFKYLRKVNLFTHKVDTIPLKGAATELTDMIVVNDKIYSLGNIYGVFVVDLNNTANEILKRNFKGDYYNEQNSISLPVDPVFNLLSSCEIDSGRYRLYGIDSAMKIKWEKTISLKDRFVPIRAFNENDGFLIKYDNQLELVSKITGDTRWHREFKFNIHNVLRLNGQEVILYLSSNNVVFTVPGLPLSDRTILKYNIKNQKVEWVINNLGTGGRLSFTAKNVLYEFLEDNRWAAIDVVNGKYKTFLFESNNDQLYVVTNKTNGNQYLYYQGKLYWFE